MSDSSTPPPRGKPVTRRTVLSRRDALSPAERVAASMVIAERAETALMVAARTVRTVALYAAKGTEVVTTGLDAALRARGIAICYPRIAGEGLRQLTFHAVAPGDLGVGQFGIHEPAATTATVDLGAIDAFVIPGVAFDRDGGRLGWGRGFYDVTLDAVRGALRIGLAFECQIVETIEHEPHDVRMDVVVTEVATRAAAEQQWTR